MDTCQFEWFIFDNTSTVSWIGWTRVSSHVPARRTQRQGWDKGRPRILSWAMHGPRLAAPRFRVPPPGEAKDDGGQQARLVCWEWDRKREPRGPRPVGGRSGCHRPRLRDAIQTRSLSSESIARRLHATARLEWFASGLLPSVDQAGDSIASWFATPRASQGPDLFSSALFVSVCKLQILHFSLHINNKNKR